MIFLRQVLDLKVASLFYHFMDVRFQWTSEIMASSKSISHTEFRNMCSLSASSHLTELWLHKGVHSRSITHFCLYKSPAGILSISFYADDATMILTNNVISCILAIRTRNYIICQYQRCAKDVSYPLWGNYWLLM